METVRILQVVGGMNRGGAETWLMHMLRNIDRERLKIDFLVHTDQICDYDNEIYSLGSRIFPCLYPSRPLDYAVRFLRLMWKHGPYNVIHSHVHHFSGFIMLLSRFAGVSKRITHSHIDTRQVESKSRILRKGYLWLSQRMINKFATAGLACSRSAAMALYGTHWENDSRWRVVYCGIDLQPFMQPVARREIRAELGIPPDALVMGHVGRFHTQKNHTFLIDIAREMATMDSHMRLLLIGDGPLRPRLEQKVAELELRGKVIFTGIRADIPRLIKGALDVFVMPSLWEGLPLAAIESQAAGIPIILSDAITGEVEVVHSLVRRLSISEPARLWAQVALDAANGVRVVRVPSPVKVIEKTSFNIKNSITEMLCLYNSQSFPG